MTTTSATSTNSASIISALGAGSGIDTKALAQNLVDAERTPQKDIIDKKITKGEARISGYAAISYSATELKNAFAAINDQKEFNSVAVRNSNSTAFGVTTTSSAEVGDYEIDVQTLARPQRSASDGLSSTVDLSGGTAFTLNLTIGDADAEQITIAAGEGTPAEIVAAINAADKGVTAQLINTGDGSLTPYKIILTGASGASNDFQMSAVDADNVPISGLSFNTTSPMQSATDAKLVVNGLTILRTTNVISDVITGVTLDLNSTTSTAATINLTRDTAALKEKFKALVVAYNDANIMLNVLADKDSTVETYGGALSGDSTVNTVRNQFRNLITSASTTAGTDASYLWQVGISLTKEGPIELDETKLDTALSTNFDNVVKMITGNTNNLSAYSIADAGIAGEAVRKLTKLVASNGMLTTQSDSTSAQISKYKVDLQNLEDRMTKLLERYQTQFGAMDSFVSQSSNLRKSLTSTFDGMANAYK